MDEFIVHRWISKDNRITYKFGENSQIKLPIYKDDNIGTIVTKITAGISNLPSSSKDTIDISTPPYLWKGKHSIRFTFNTQEKIPINPWELGDDIVFKGQIKEVNYKSNELFNGNELNIIFINDIKFKDSKLVNIFFPDKSVKWQVPTFKSLKTEADKLYEVWKLNDSRRLSLDLQILTKAMFVSKVSNKISYATLVELYKSFNTNDKIPLIQLIYDENKIIYKSYQHHKIAQHTFTGFLMEDNIGYTTSLNIYFSTNRQNIFAKISIEESLISVKYSIDTQEKISFKYVLEHLEKIKEFLNKNLKSNFEFVATSLSLREEFKSSLNNVHDIAKWIGILKPIFHIVKIQTGVIEGVYKRSSNYQDKIDIIDYIKSRITFGLTIPEIRQELTELGMNSEDITISIEEYKTNIISEINATHKKKTLNNVGCTFRIIKGAIGYKINIDNITNSRELNILNDWFSSTIAYSESNSKKKIGPVPITPIPIIKKDESVPDSESDSKSDEKGNALKELEKSASSLEFEGGALGKDLRGYFLSRLQNADPKIFVNTKEYPRLCAANDFRQPNVVSKKQKEFIDANGYAKGYDNSILYGSEETNKNWYMCPRIWCPKSEVPLTLDQLKENNNKCPGPDFEEPILIYDDKYWKNDYERPHYIGFHTKKSPDGLNLPCCMTRKPKDNFLDKPLKEGKEKPLKEGKDKPEEPIEEKSIDTNIKNQGDGYLISTGAPVDEGRFGNIPKDLHDNIFTTVQYSSCNRTLTTQKCLVRKGINHGDDSIMNAIASSLNINKTELIKRIKNIINPLIFISLENGNILQAFQDNEAIIPSKNIELVKKWKKWIIRFPKYKKMFNIDELNIEEDKLSRELAIYNAYNNFFEYLASNDIKNPYHLIDILHNMNILLVIWRKVNNETVSIMCPYFKNVYDLINSISHHDKYLMLMQDGEYYEPLQLKQRNKEGISLIEKNILPNIKNLLDQCPKPNESNVNINFLDTLRGLSYWMKNILFDATPFTPKSIVLRPDLNVYGLLTYGNLFITIPKNGVPIGMISDLIEIFDIKHILHIEDIAGQVYESTYFSKGDYRLIVDKFNKLGLGLIIGTEKRHTELDITSTLVTIPKTILMKSIPIIKIYDHVLSINNQNDKNDKESIKWYNTQLGIAREILKYYDTLITPKLLSKTRTERIGILMNTFPKLPKNIVQVTLEELPLEYGKEELSKWISAFANKQVYEIFISDAIFHDKKHKQWIFSQIAIDNGLPDYIIYPPSGPQPKKELNIKITDASQIKFDKGKNSNLGISREMPSMLSENKITKEELPSKWTLLKSSWLSFSILHSNNYSKTLLPELVSWLGKSVKIDINWNDILLMRNKYIFDLLKKKIGVELLMNDPSLLETWNDHISKKYKTGTLLWDKYISKDVNKAKLEWVELSKSNKLYPMDLDLYILSKLLDIAIFLIHRSKNNKKEVAQRGGIEDLFKSSTLFVGSKNWKNRPIIILFKENEEKFNTYHGVINSEMKYSDYIIPTIAYIQDDIKELIKMHIDNFEDRYI